MKIKLLHQTKLYLLATFMVAGLILSTIFGNVAQAATDPCPNGGTLNTTTARCQYTAADAGTQYDCLEGHDGVGTTCTYTYTQPTCTTGGYVWWEASGKCLSSTTNGLNSVDCSQAGDTYFSGTGGPEGSGCYDNENVGNLILCPDGGTYSSTLCTYNATPVQVYSCNNGDTLSGTTCSYQAVLGTMSDTQPGTTLTIPAQSTITVDGERGTTTVQSGGKLMGTGKVGALTVNTGASVAPGHSPGVLQSGNLTLNGTYEFELGGATAGDGSGYHDQIDVTGTVNVTGATLTASLYGGFVPTANQSFVIVNNDGSDAVTGTFTGLAEGATFQNQGVTYKVSYVGGTGNDITLTVSAIDASKLPTVPNTGLALLRTNPVMVLLASLGAAAGLVLIARRIHA